MNFSAFRIEFVTGEKVEINAFCLREAEILAQADQIRKGNDYTIVRSSEIKKPDKVKCELSKEDLENILCHFDDDEDYEDRGQLITKHKLMDLLREVDPGNVLLEV